MLIDYLTDLCAENGTEWNFTELWENVGRFQPEIPESERSESKCDNY